MEKDIILKRYLSDDERFADLLNGYVFQGAQKVRPEDLTEMDSQISLFSDWGFFRKARLRYRDLLRRVAYDVATQYSNSKELRERRNQYRNGGVINMCQAIKELMEDRKLEGIECGIEQGEKLGRQEFATLVSYLLRDDRYGRFERSDQQ